jgi:hypothetical protein
LARRLALLTLLARLPVRSMWLVPHLVRSILRARLTRLFLSLASVPVPSL